MDELLSERQVYERAARGRRPEREEVTCGGAARIGIWFRDESRPEAGYWQKANGERIWRKAERLYRESKGGQR